MMETTAGPAGVATANEAVGRLLPMDTTALESYLGIGAGVKGTRRVTEEGDNEDEEGGFRMGGPGAPGVLHCFWTDVPLALHKHVQSLCTPTRSHSDEE